MPPPIGALKKQQEVKNENNNKKIIRSLQNATKRTRTNATRKLKEKKDLNDKLTSTKLVAQWPQRTTKALKENGLQEVTRVSSHKDRVVLYTS